MEMNAQRMLVMQQPVVPTPLLAAMILTNALLTPAMRQPAVPIPQLAVMMRMPAQPMIVFLQRAALIQLSVVMTAMLVQRTTHAILPPAALMRP